jgi:murein DD-endopeptidase MepM/ murein hydrolase activator NlpD
MRIRTYIIAFSVILATTGLTRTAWALDAATQQHIQELQAQIAALEAQAAQYRSGIAEQQDKAASLNGDIAILKGQIGSLQAQISSTGAKIEETQLEIGGVKDHIAQTRDQLTQKRDSVGRMILFLDQADHQNLLASLVKFEKLSDFLAQLHDLASVQSRVMNAIDDLKSLKASLESDQADLESHQSNLQQLKDQADQRKLALDSVKYQKDTLLKQTKGQEALYQKQLQAVEKKKAAFFAEMQKLESSVIAGGLYIVHVTADHVPAKGTKIFRKPEDNTHLTQGYGMTVYARRGAYGGAPHNGYDFSAGYGSPIVAIGAGTVIARGSNDGFGNWIAIQHTNNMVSIYGHMSAYEPSVVVGTAVAEGQTIGYEGNTGNSTGSHVHLSIYKDFFTYINEKNGQLYFNYFEGSVNPGDYLK